MGTTAAAIEKGTRLITRGRDPLALWPHTLGKTGGHFTTTRNCGTTQSQRESRPYEATYVAIKDIVRGFDGDARGGGVIRAHPETVRTHMAMLGMRHDSTGSDHKRNRPLLGDYHVGHRTKRQRT